MTKIPCPFTYSKGKRCPGHIVEVRAFKADIQWTQQEDGSWKFGVSEPRSHYHLYCSEKGHHSGWGKEDALKFSFNELPAELRVVITTA